MPSRGDVALLRSIAGKCIRVLDHGWRVGKFLGGKITELAAEDASDFLNLMRVARVGVSDIIAHPAKGEFIQMDHLLETDTQSIMYPRCESTKEATKVVWFGSRW